MAEGARRKSDQHGARTRNLLIPDRIVVRHTTNCANRPCGERKTEADSFQLFSG